MSSMDMMLDQEVEDWQHDVGQELPDLASKEHPQHMVLRFDADPAPAHGHLRRVIANLVKTEGGHCDAQRDPPADQVKIQHQTVSNSLTGLYDENVQVNCDSNSPEK